jgi:dihydrofolate synthase/folylpolyglutamate synthase
MPGRLEVVHRKPTVYVDIGHTGKAILATAQALKEFSDKGLILLLGCSDDKQPALLAPLLDVAEAVICSRARHRGGDPARIQSWLRTHNPELSCLVEPELDAAVSTTMSMAQSRGLPAAVVGGLFLAMEAKAHLTGAPIPVWA